jgi:hypothetical protein
MAGGLGGAFSLCSAVNLTLVADSSSGSGADAEVVVDAASGSVADADVVGCATAMPLLALYSSVSIRSKTRHPHVTPNAKSIATIHMISVCSGHEHCCSISV